ncbi:hypothetical protein pb186bvf_007556 [Paramecium bursaria]
MKLFGFLMKLLITWFKGLRMRSQVLLLQVMIAILVIILLLFTYSIILTKGVDLIRQSSNQDLLIIFYIKQNDELSVYINFSKHGQITRNIFQQVLDRNRY